MKAVRSASVVAPVIKYGLASVALVVACLCVGGLASTASVERAERMRPIVGETSRAPRPQAATIIPWSKLPSAQIVDGELGPESGALPMRPSLELAGSPAGWAGRVVQGDGVAAVQAVRVGLVAEADGGAGCARREAQVISVGAGALAVSARRDGLWVMYRERLVHVDERGVARKVVPLAGAALAGDVLEGRSLAGATLVGGAEDAAWLVGGAQAWHVDAEGSVRGPYPWRGEPGEPALAVGERLCGRARAANALVCLDRRGVSEKRTLGFSLSSGEEPLALSLMGDPAAVEVLTAHGATLRRWRGRTLVEEQAVQAAGVDAVRRSFAMSAEGGALVLGRQGDDAAPGKALRFPAMAGGGLDSASIEGARVTLYRQGVMVRYPGEARDAGTQEARADEAAYRHAIFPSAWRISRRGAVAAAGCTSGGPVIGVAASGPGGVVIVPLSLSDR